MWQGLAERKSLGSSSTNTLQRKPIRKPTIDSIHIIFNTTNKIIRICKRNDHFLLFVFDIKGLTLDSTFLNLESLNECSSTSFFLFDYLEGLIGT